MLSPKLNSAWKVRALLTAHPRSSVFDLQLLSGLSTITVISALNFLAENDALIVAGKGKDGDLFSTR